jgi:hypothetical protein
MQPNDPLKWKEVTFLPWSCLNRAGLSLIKLCQFMQGNGQ